MPMKAAILVTLIALTTLLLVGKSEAVKGKDNNKKVANGKEIRLENAFQKVLAEKHSPDSVDGFTQHIIPMIMNEAEMGRKAVDAYLKKDKNAKQIKERFKALRKENRVKSNRSKTNVSLDIDSVKEVSERQRRLGVRGGDEAGKSITNDVIEDEEKPSTKRKTKKKGGRKTKAEKPQAVQAVQPEQKGDGGNAEKAKDTNGGDSSFNIDDI